jgi:hypothetical protein
MLSELGHDCGGDDRMKSRSVLGIVSVVALVVGLLRFTGLGQDVARYWRITRM